MAPLLGGRVSIERREFLALGSLAAIFAGGGAAWWRLYGAPTDRARVRLEEVSGTVERLSGGGVAPASAGEGLSVGDRLQTGADGRAVIGFGEGGRVVLKPEGRVEVLAAGDQLVRLELEEGTVEATLRPADGRLSVLAAGQSFEAGGSGGSGGAGGEAAAFTLSRRGEVTGLSVAAGDVRVAPGSGDPAPGDPAPGDPPGPIGVVGAGGRQIWVAGAPAAGPISESLLLSVSWPEPRTRAGSVPVRGQTEPGARVRLQSAAGIQETVAGPDGSFTIEVPLLEGGNALAVEVAGVMGGTQRAGGRVERDTTAPAVSVQIRDH